MSDADQAQKKFRRDAELRLCLDKIYSLREEIDTFSISMSEKRRLNWEIDDLKQALRVTQDDLTAVYKTK